MTEKIRMTELHKRNRAIQDELGRTIIVEHKAVKTQPRALVHPMSVMVEKQELENGVVRLRVKRGLLME